MADLLWLFFLSSLFLIKNKEEKERKRQGKDRIVEPILIEDDPACNTVLAGSGMCPLIKGFWVSRAIRKQKARPSTRSNRHAIPRDMADGCLLLLSSFYFPMKIEERRKEQPGTSMPNRPKKRKIMVGHPMSPAAVFFGSVCQVPRE